LEPQRPGPSDRDGPAPGAGVAVTNFERTLPPPQSDLAKQITKDPYAFDFLMLGEDTHERELEQGLLAHLRHFLLELGVGFAFVVSQYRLDVGDSDFFIDLLFYHLKLRCSVVTELKAKAFARSRSGKVPLPNALLGMGSKVSNCAAGPVWNVVS
jgi:predicted nuclease of restriction endonuclease-like (RecB) superfamily